MGDRKKKDDPEQSQRFIDTAEKLKSDKSGKLFELAIKAVTKDPKSKGGNNEKGAANRP